MEAIFDSSALSSCPMGGSSSLNKSRGDKLERERGRGGTLLCSVLISNKINQDLIYSQHEFQVRGTSALKGREGGREGEGLPFVISQFLSRTEHLP